VPSHKLISVAVAFFGLVGSVTTLAQAPSYSVLYSFTGSGGDGANPYAGLIMDASGNLYGTTGGGGNGGTVFELVNSSGTYSEIVLYSFTGSGGDGANPAGGLLMDASGNLYGTTVRGGNINANCQDGGCGTVFELVNSSGAYRERVLYSFTGSGGDGANPEAGLIMDASGNLYGTTAAGGYGTVFELVNSSGTYSEKVLYSFTGGSDGAVPLGGVIMDGSGNLYGTTEEGGTNGWGAVFELVNSSGNYSETVLWSSTRSGGESPYRAGVIMDTSGNLYGTTGGGGNGYGTVFELVNSSGNYTENVLYSFTNSGGDGANPEAGLIMDALGNLYSTTFYGGTSGNGTVFELFNSSGTYNETLYSFNGPPCCGGDGANPGAGLIMDASGNLYGTTLYGGTYGYGTVFQLAGIANVSVSSNINPSTYGQAVTFTTTISSGSGEVRRHSTRKRVRSQDATGTVTWSANSGCGTTTVTSGTATCTTSNLGLGSGTITATYSAGTSQVGNTGVMSGAQVVNQASQKITFTINAPASAGYNSQFTVAATANSGLAVTFTSAGSCSNLGATYTMTSATGTCSVIANQSGNANYLAAPQVTEMVTATKGRPVVSFTGAPANADYGATFNVTATENSGITPTITASGACTISGTTVTMTSGTGTCTTTAKWAANADYNGVTLTQKTTAELIKPTVTFTGAPARARNGKMFTVTAKSNEAGNNASVPTITASGSCTAGAVSNNGPGSYHAPITITRNSGTCIMTAKWTKTIEYASETLTQKTTAEK
jgi:hypothetical protein